MQTVTQANIYVATDSKRTVDEENRIIARIISRYDMGGFVQQGVGIDAGAMERSYRITISGYGDEPDTFRARIHEISRALRDVFQQNCVLVDYTTTEAECSHDFAAGAPSGAPSGEPGAGACVICGGPGITREFADGPVDYCPECFDNPQGRRREFATS